MKKDSGVTLVSLVVYIIVMIIVIAIMSGIITNFYKNTTTVQASVEDIIKLNNFNKYFLKEIKTYDNSIDTKTDNFILFSSGNSFSISDNIIYYNDIQVCDKVDSIFFETTEEDIPLKERTIIKVTLNFKTFKKPKTINYKIENMY